MAAPEVPDWTRPVSVMGKDSEGNPVTVLLDSLGRLICVLYGAITLSGPVDVTQVDSTREIQGADGVTLHTIAVDNQGRIIALIKGVHDSTLINVAVDASGQLIMVPRGATGNYMQVTTEGYLVTILKGEYDGTIRTVMVDSSGNIVAAVKGMYGTDLKNVAVDSAGRMIMIPTDPADVWGNAISMGNAELASLLSPAKRYDRRGNVIFMDTFEDGLCKIATSLNGTGAAVALTAAEALFGAYSCNMTGGSTGGLNAIIIYRLPKPTVSKIGLEFHYRIGSNVNYVLGRVLYYDGTNAHAGSIRYDVVNSKYQYLNSAASWTDLVTDILQPETSMAFYGLKLVIDPSTDKFVRALLYGQEVDMSALALRKYLSGMNPSLQCQIEVYSVSGYNGWAYVDDVIITQNE